MLPISRPGRVLATAAATALLLATAPAAMGATSTLHGSINPNKGPIGSPIRLTMGFTVAPGAGLPGPIISKVEFDFPPNARTNGARFPSCDPAVINARRSASGCAKGSKIGTGKAIADVPATDVFNVPARLTLFNGKGGKSVTVFVEAENPVLIAEAFTAPLRKTSGRFGYHLTAQLPPSLQEISDGWFAQVKRFDSTVSATWRGTPYIESTTLCPRSLSVPIASKITFSTLDNRNDGTASSSAVIRCRR